MPKIKGRVSPDLFYALKKIIRVKCRVGRLWIYLRVNREFKQAYILDVVQTDTALVPYYNAVEVIFEHTKLLSGIQADLDPVDELYQQFSDELSNTGMLTEALLVKFLIDLSFIQVNIVNSATAEVWEVTVEKFSTFLERAEQLEHIMVSNSKLGAAKIVNFYSWILALCNYDSLVTLPKTNH